jgi:hypothetical protein
MNSHRQAKENGISHGIVVHDETLNSRSQDGLREHGVLAEMCILGELQGPSTDEP